MKICNRTYIHHHLHAHIKREDWRNLAQFSYTDTAYRTFGFPETTNIQQTKNSTVSIQSRKIQLLAVHSVLYHVQEGTPTALLPQPHRCTKICMPSGLREMNMWSLFSSQLQHTDFVVGHSLLFENASNDAYSDGAS